MRLLQDNVDTAVCDQLQFAPVSSSFCDSKILFNMINYSLPLFASLHAVY